MTERLAIIDYGSGNLRSVEKACLRVAREAGLAIDISVTASADDIAAADRIILPGVGAFAACRQGLAALPGVIEALEHAVLAEKRPFLGICVGMQLLASRGLEFGETDGLGWIAGDVKRLELSDPALRLPHMGWNKVTNTRPHPVLDVLGDGSDVYFVHSYYFDAENDIDITAICHYGEPFTAAVARDNILGVQFHPEKSQAKGLALLGAFLKWTPNV